MIYGVSMFLLKFFKFYSCHNFKGCSLCNFTRCKITKQLQPPKGVLQLMLTHRHSNHRHSKHLPLRSRYSHRKRKTRNSFERTLLVETSGSINDSPTAVPERPLNS